MNTLLLTAAPEDGQLSSWLNALSRLDLTLSLSALLIFLAGYALIHWLCRLLARLLERNQRMDPSIRSLLVHVIRILLLFLLALTCADRLGLPTDSIVTLLGTFGLAFSLAMQNSLSNLAGGMFILGSKPFETGDYVEVAGVEGTVSQIGFIHTALTTVDNKTIHVPNSTITGSVITNYSQCETRRVDLTIPVPYTCPLDQAKEVIEQVIRRDGRILEAPAAPFVRVWELEPSAVRIMVRVWVAAGDYWEVRSRLLQDIKEQLEQAGMPIPHSRLDVRLTETK